MGGKLAFPTHANLWDDEQSVSRAKLYLTADGDGFDAATHYVYTADCGLNILQYRYVDANQAAALLAK